MTIVISEDVKAPASTKSLLGMLVASNEKWPSGATCATQEQDGEILFWNAPIEQIKQAREKAGSEHELIPMVGFEKQVSVLYVSEGDQDVVAVDWMSSVVTLEQFTNQSV